MAPRSQKYLGLWHTLKPRGISHSNTFWLSKPCCVFLKSLVLGWRYYVTLSKGQFYLSNLQGGRKNIEDVMQMYHEKKTTPNPRKTQIHYLQTSKDIFWFLVILLGYRFVILTQNANAVHFPHLHHVAVSRCINGLPCWAHESSRLSPRLGCTGAVLSAEIWNEPGFSCFTSSNAVTPSTGIWR